MKPFYSIQELAELLKKDVQDVVNGLVADEITPVYDGKAVDSSRLSSWWKPLRPGPGGVISIFVGGSNQTPRPSEVIVSSKHLSELWKECLSSPNNNSTDSAPVVSDDGPWEDKAREFADKLDEIDKQSGAHDSVKGIADRVADSLRKEGVLGPRGPLSGATVLREALQGGKWKRKN